jgi:NTP pyrophosphatase (non-canonical NTP hydrolase)
MKDTKTITELIAHWSQTFGLPIKQGLGFPSRDRMELSIKLIEEELSELKHAVDNRDLTEVQDGLGDLLWVTVRAMMEFGIDPKKTIESIYDSNMSKADFTEEDAQLTKAKYKEQGINTYMKFVGPVIITYRASDSKVLKSHRFKEPKL